MLKQIRKRWQHVGIFAGSKYDRLRDRVFTGHFNVGPVTIYGANAMHYAVNVRTGDGWICFRPTTGREGAWRWYLYVSPDATPGRAWWGTGPGFRGERAGG